MALFPHPLARPQTQLGPRLVQKGFKNPNGRLVLAPLLGLHAKVFVMRAF